MKLLLRRGLAMKIKAIVFDMDDTLYDEKDYVQSGLTVLDNWVKFKFKVNGFYETAMTLFEAGERESLFNKTFELLKIRADKKTMNEMLNRYRAHIPQIKLFDDVNWVLSNLTKEIKVGLLSDGHIEQQANKVRALRIRGRFHSIILSDRFGRQNWKPSSVPYEHMCMALEVSHYDCLYIGSNVSKDFITAKRLGWKTVHIDRGNNNFPHTIEDKEYAAHYKINNLQKLSHISEFKHLFIKKAELVYS
ncbi:HAD family hydrolase [Metabacillus fastidiosus]|uniref:HAD family hydrolase n=2 Tax=Metabacillus fastidiosus TaxID=1458 RepID=A0ABU6NW09_9BACI|nr:HAD family hydrolase [Metabacillus fastidiosus]MED4400908.1 HAD family hydrolase [Metabacillus fastidiosus]MED4463834.1 HAD family hydrolase [Metabacillus fastidiosus]